MKCKTREELNKENYAFTKDLYFDLIVDSLKKKDKKSVDQLKHDWQEIEELYKNG